jgi:hypothetical protein
MRYHLDQQQIRQPMHKPLSPGGRGLFGASIEKQVRRQAGTFC